MSTPRDPRPQRLTRRALLSALGAATTLVAPGCTGVDDPAPRRGRGRAEREPDLEPDVLLAATVVRSLRAVLETLDATARRHPRLGRRLAELTATHTEHVRILADATPDDASSTPSPSTRPDGRRVPRRQARALRQVVVLEQELTLTLKRHAFAAESGQFSRLLASMSASAAQYAAQIGELQLSAARAAGADR